MDTLAATPAQYTPISAASSGDNTLLAAQVDAQGNAVKIRVMGIYLHAVTAVAVRLESGAGGTALTGVISLGATSGWLLPYSEAGWCETAVNALLNLELGGAVQVSGLLVWKKA